MSSRVVVILCPNGRRQHLKVMPTSSNLQILEDVCRIQGLKSEDFDLKHSNKLLDLTSTVQFSNLPNNAQLELVKATKLRKENFVQIGLQLENGKRFIESFAPTTSLWDIINKFYENPQFELCLGSSDGIPVCVYMRREIIGEETLKQTTLRVLGLVSGNAIIRLTYRRPLEEIPLTPFTEMEFEPSSAEERESTLPMPSSSAYSESIRMDVVDNSSGVVNSIEDIAEPEISSLLSSAPSNSTLPGVTTYPATDVIVQLRERNAFVFNLDHIKHTNEDVPDDFFEVTVEDVRLLMADLVRKRQELESAPFQTQEMKEAEMRQKLDKYHHATIRVYFPDRLVLQGHFKTTEKVGDIINFLRHFLVNESLNFYLFTTPPKRILDPNLLLINAQLVPGAVVYFGCNSPTESRFLRPEVYNQLSSPQDANIEAAMASRAITGEFHAELSPTPHSHQMPRTSKKTVAGEQQAKSTTLPKWFQQGDSKRSAR